MNTTDIQPNLINTHNHAQPTSEARNGAIRAGARGARCSGPLADCADRKEMRNQQ